MPTLSLTQNYLLTAHPVKLSRKKVKACKPNVMIRVTIEKQSDMKTHIATMFKSQILTVVPNAEQITDDLLSETLLQSPEMKVIYGKDNKMIVYIKLTSSTLY